MSVYTHPDPKKAAAGWKMIKISHGRTGKPDYIPYLGSTDSAKQYENEIRGIADRSDPEFTDKMPSFKIAYKNEVSSGTFGDFENALKQLEPFFKSYKLRHISQQIIEQYKTYRLAMPNRSGGTICKRTINRELTYLSKYLSYCGSTLKPVKFRKRDTQPPIPNVLTLEEIKALISGLTPPVKHLVQLMTYNGLRKSEAFGVLSENAEKDGTLVRVCGKGNKWRMVPVELPELQKAIKAAKKTRPDGYLFPNPATNKPYTDIRKHLTKAAALAGITKPVYNHLMRHSFGTALVKQGVNLRIVQGLLGHADLKTVQIYTHLADDTLRSGTAALVKNVAIVANPKTRATKQTRSNK